MKKNISKIIHVAIPIGLSVTGLLSTLLIVHLLQNGTIPTWKVSSNGMINFTFTMQLLVLVNSFIMLGIIYWYNPGQFALFFRLGKISNWKYYGIGTALAFTIGTTMMMSGNVIAQHGTFNAHFFSLLPLVLLFAATNAWSEEIFSRFVIVAGLYGKLPPLPVCNISAIIFGLAHYGGTPSGVFGIIAAGLLGWILAKSVLETKGMAWALFIHFLQDLVIFGAGAMMIAGGR